MRRRPNALPLTRAPPARALVAFNLSDPAHKRLESPHPVLQLLVLHPQRLERSHPRLQTLVLSGQPVAPHVELLVLRAQLLVIRLQPGA